MEIDTLAQLTSQKQGRDAQGRYTSRDNRAATSTSSDQPPDDSTLPSTDHTRAASSRLSGNYKFIIPTPQTNTPNTASPVNLPLPLPPIPQIPPSTLPPPILLPTSQTTTGTEDMAAEAITPFQGDKEDENPEDFLCAFYRRMGNKTDDTRKAQFKFPYYLQADSMADEWYADLVDIDKKTRNDIEIAFRKRWPRKKQVKKTDDEYKDEIMGRKLKAEDLGKKEKVEGREVYTHVAWADKMATSVKGAKWETTTNQLRQVRKNLPNILREKDGTGHTNWEEFLKAVRNVDVEYIRDSIDIKNKEQAAIDQRLQTLETVSRSPTAPLRQQLSSVAISSQSPAHSSQVVGDPFANVGGGRGNLAFTTNQATFCQTKPLFTGSNPRPAPTPEQKAEIHLLLNRFTHHPDTQPGRQAHQAQQAEWVKTFGYGAKVTEKTPYPLRPGTAPMNSGECFTCGYHGHLGTWTGETCEALGHQPNHCETYHERSKCPKNII